MKIKLSPRTNAAVGARSTSEFVAENSPVGFLIIQKMFEAEKVKTQIEW
jgi:hypothetical protein